VFVLPTLIMSISKIVDPSKLPGNEFSCNGLLLIHSNTLLNTCFTPYFWIVHVCDVNFYVIITSQYELDFFMPLTSDVINFEMRRNTWSFIYLHPWNNNKKFTTHITRSLHFLVLTIEIITTIIISLLNHHL